MNLSRKRRRELKQLRGNAQELLEHQRVVLGHAGDVLHEASRQAKQLSDEHLAPRIEDTLEAVRPTVDRGVASARKAARSVRRATTPFVAGALATAIHKLDDLDQRDAAAQVRGFGEKVGYLQPAKKRSSGGVIALVIGAVAAVGVGYALWQAFRTDDELWIAPENN